MQVATTPDLLTGLKGGDVLFLAIIGSGRIVINSRIGRRTFAFCQSTLNKISDIFNRFCGKYLEVIGVVAGQYRERITCDKSWA